MSLATKFGLLGVTALAACSPPQARFQPNGTIINNPDGSSTLIRPAQVPVQCTQGWSDMAGTSGNHSVIPGGGVGTGCADELTVRGNHPPPPSVLNQMATSTIQAVQWEAQGQINNAIQGAIRGIDLGF